MAPFQKFLSLQLCATEIKENRERIIHPEMDALMEKRVKKEIMTTRRKAGGWAAAGRHS